jgi:hypothetical protein
MAGSSKFILFSGKIILQKKDLSLIRIWAVLSKRNTASDKIVTLQDSSDILKNDPHSGIITSLTERFKSFQLFTRIFKNGLKNER